MRYRIGSSKARKTYLIFSLLLLIEVFLPSMIAYAVSVSVFLYFVYCNKGKIVSPFRGMKYLYLIIILGTVIGFISMSLGKFETRDFIRDIYYFTNPLFVIINGAYFKKRLKEDSLFFNSIVAVAGVQALYYLLHAIVVFLGQGAGLSFINWRLIFKDSNPIAAAAVVILLIDSLHRFVTLKKSVRITVCVMCILEILISFSRTNLLLVIVTTLVVAIQRGVFKNARKWLEYIALTIAVIGVAVVLLGRTDAVTTFVEKTANSITEISTALDWSSAAVIQRNWRGYETHSALVQFGSYPLHRQILGYGFGERIEVGIYANLFLSITNTDGSAATSIPVLHNGYSTMLCKLGITGIILYLAFYISLLDLGRKRKNINRRNSELLIAIVISIAIETYFLNGLFRENINYPFIYLIGYLSYSLKVKENYNVADEQSEAVFSF